MTKRKPTEVFRELVILALGNKFDGVLADGCRPGADCQ